MGSGSLSLSQLTGDPLLAWPRLWPQKPLPHTKVHIQVTCSFQRKSRRAVDSICCAWRYSARANTSRITGVIYLSATLPTAGLKTETHLVSEGLRPLPASSLAAPEPSLTSPAHRRSHWRKPWQEDTKVTGCSLLGGTLRGKRDYTAELTQESSLWAEPPIPSRIFSLSS